MFKSNAEAGRGERPVTPVISEFRDLRQEDNKFEGSLGCDTGSGSFWRRLTKNRFPKIRPEELGPSAVAAQGPRNRM